MGEPALHYLGILLRERTHHLLVHHDDPPRVSRHSVFAAWALVLSRRSDWRKSFGTCARVVFPGGALPTVTLLVSSLERATSGRLIVDSISNIGPHYARTLREWRHCFVDNFAEIEGALRKEHPGVFDSEQGERAAHELAVFRRKWLCKT